MAVLEVEWRFILLSEWWTGFAARRTTHENVGNGVGLARQYEFFQVILISVVLILVTHQRSISQESVQ